MLRSKYRRIGFANVFSGIKHDFFTISLMIEGFYEFSLDDGSFIAQTSIKLVESSQ